MKQNVLLDTGPLVAFLNGRDRYHDWAVLQLADIAPPRKLETSDVDLRASTCDLEITSSPQEPDKASWNRQESNRHQV